MPPAGSEPPPGEPPQHPFAVALEWVSRIAAAVVVMVGLGLGGRWLDQKLGTHYWVLVGFLFGLPVGIGYLIWVTQRLQSGRRPPNQNS